MFVGFSCALSSIITGHWDLLFLRVRWDFTCVQCDVCIDKGTSFIKSNPRRQVRNVQLIPYSRGLQQNKHRKLESKLYPIASTGSQVQFTTPWLIASGFESPQRQKVVNLFQDSISYRCFTKTTLCMSCFD